MAVFNPKDFRNVTDSQLLANAKRGKKISDELAHRRVMGAWHEAAHLVAAVADQQACIYEVGIASTKGSCNTNQGQEVDGYLKDLHAHPWWDAFVLMAGYAQEERRGDVALAADDYAEAIKLDRWDTALQEARKFVKRYAKLIKDTAAAILLYSTAEGILRGENLESLWNYIYSKTKTVDREHLREQANYRRPRAA